MNEQIKRWNEKLARKEFDLSLDEDLSLAIMNLVSLEEHAFFTAQKSGEQEYYDLLQRFRATRTDLLKEIVTDPQGEEWCMSKHLMSTTMRLLETGNKFYAQDPTRAEQLYDYAFDMYSLFWHINTRDKNTKTPTKTTKNTPETKTTPKTTAAATPNKSQEQQADGLLAKARAFVKDAIDCCKEL